MKWISIAAAVVLAGCGIIYNSPRVAQGTDASGINVAVVPVTPSTLAEANASPYKPRALPAAFHTTTGGPRAGRSAPTLPEPPYRPETRPAGLELRVPPPAPETPYRIGVEDELRLAVPQSGSTAAELAGLLAKATARQGYRVQDDGTISIPDVGRVHVAGLTLAEAEDAIFDKLVAAGVNPVFSLEVSDFRSQRVTIGGAVGKPAVVPITLSPLRLVEALNAAGGIQLADDEYASIRIFRNGRLYQIPVRDYYARAELQNLRLKDRDSIFVDTDFDVEKAAAYFEQQIRLSSLRHQERVQALSELTAEMDFRRRQLDEVRGLFMGQLELDAVERDYVYLAGEVGKQTRIALPFGRRATLADALYADGGGFRIETGDARQVYVLRGAGDAAEPGRVTAWQLDLSNIGNMVLATRFELRPNDIVFVAEQPVTRWSRVIKQLSPSLILSTI
ncbi:MAG: sugar transporter, partial [Alphaproteobacteria bacterium]